jgi:hypothetical protein
MVYKGQGYIIKPDGSTENDWFKYECGHCGAKVSGAVVARYENIMWLLSPNCGNGSVCDQKGNIRPEVAFGPHIAGLPSDIA